ncbi:MAG: tRNA preQ1(34) S-adenosylmethionine ribosyltransferase-isomerase QueA [Vicinamibacterales bacterium]
MILGNVRRYKYGQVLVSDFDFDLPDDLIAQDAAPRGASRLLVLDRETGGIEHSTVADLPNLLRSGDVLAVNNTRVFAARLLGHRVPSGGAVECLLLGQPAPSDDGSAVGEALMHPGQKLKPGAIVGFEGAGGALLCEVLAQEFFGRRRVRFRAESGGDVDTLIDRLGHMPLPPYIKRADTALDRERYQTVFASVRGSVAAPTAGLHFTPAMIDAIEARGVERVAITLHIGYGTFKPVRTAVVEDHVVDPEHYEIEASAAERLNRARREGRRVIAVGTTTTRALEDSARRGDGSLIGGPAEATTFIHPGFRFQVVEGLMTNFHLPRSSLLMLVAAFAGRKRVLTAYREAVHHRYRFYSYGDAMLVV